MHDPALTRAGSSSLRGSLPEWSRRTGFRPLLAARLVSQAADGVFEASLVSYELFSPQRSPDAPSIALGLAVVLLPFSVLGPFAGVVLDRGDRRRTLIVCGLLRAALAVAAVGTVSGNGSGPALAAVAIAVLACSRLVLSGLSAALPLVVSGPDLVAAGSFSTTAGTAATAAGLGLGAGVRAVGGSGGTGLAAVCLTAALAYLAAAAAAAASRPGSLGPPAGEAAVPGIARQAGLAVGAVAAGARHVWARPQARHALIAINLGRLGYGMTFVSTLLVLHAGRPGLSGVASLGAVGAGLGLGTVAGAVLAPVLARRLGRPAVVSTGLITGGVAAAVAVPGSHPVLLVLAAPVLGFAQQVSKVSTDALIQAQVADAFRGRAFALVDMAFSVSYVLASVIAAVTVPADGHAPVALALAGAGWAVAGGWHAATVRADRASAGSVAESVTED